MGCAGGVGAMAALRNSVDEIALDDDGVGHKGRRRQEMHCGRANILDCCLNKRDARRAVDMTNAKTAIWFADAGILWT